MLLVYVVYLAHPQKDALSEIYSFSRLLYETTKEEKTQELMRHVMDFT